MLYHYNAIIERLLVTGNKNTEKVKVIPCIKIKFLTFAAKYVNLIVKKSAHANYFREAK